MSRALETLAKTRWAYRQLCAHMDEMDRYATCAVPTGTLRADIAKEVSMAQLYASQLAGLLTEMVDGPGGSEPPR